MNKIAGVFLIFISLALIACNDKSKDAAVKEAVKAALEEERAKQALETQKQQSQSPQAQPIIIQQPTPEPVVIKQATPQPVVIQQNSSSHYIMTQTDGYVFMRDAPHAKARKIAKLNDKTAVNIIDCGNYEYRSDVTSGNEGSWCRVSADGHIGYVFSSYIRAGSAY